MKFFFQKLNNKIKNWVSEFLLKRFLIPLVLCLIYIFLVGPTSIVAKIFFRKKLNRRNESEITNWHINLDENLTIEDLKGQS